MTKLTQKHESSLSLKLEHNHLLSRAILAFILSIVVNGLCSYYLIAEERESRNQLSQFATTGSDDSPTKAASREFTYPSIGSSGLWIGSIPRSAKVFIAQADQFRDLPWEKNEEGAILFLAEGGMVNSRTGDFVLEPKIDWIDVGCTPVFLKNLEPGEYAVNVIPIKGISSGFIGERPGYVAEDTRDSKMIIRRCQDDRLDNTPLYFVQVEEKGVAAVCALVYSKNASLEYILKAYPHGSNFKCGLSKQEMENDLQEEWDITPEAAKQAVEMLERGGFTVYPPKNPKGRAWISPEGDFIMEVALGVIRNGKLELTERGQRLLTRIQVPIPIEVKSSTVPKTSESGVAPREKVRSNEKFLQRHVVDNQRLPPFEGDLIGANEVRIRNPNQFEVSVGLRSTNRGRNFRVPPNGISSVHVPNGKYDIYFIYSSEPNSLFQGDSFTLGGNGVEIQIVKVVDGNYAIRRVK
ncbi:hypothetical protein ACFL3Q_07410 [Planctomycetota bacterium]